MATLGEKPYVGVTDFENRGQVESCKKTFAGRFDRVLHVGAMCSFKTINKIPTERGWENFWLSEDGLNALFANDPDVLNVIHYADYSSPVKTTPKDLSRAVEMSGPFVNAIQLDMLWPAANLLDALREAHPKTGVILQVSSKAMDKHPDEWPKMIAMLAATGLADHFLVDFGMGTGTAFDPATALSCVRRAVDSVGENRVSFAGGLGPDTYQNAAGVFKEFPNTGCDAQGRLRLSRSAIDPLEMDLVEAYLRGILSIAPSVSEQRSGRS